MEHYDIFKGPFKADECSCYIWCNGGTQVCFDVMDERDAALGKRIAACLNNEPGAKRFDNIGVSADGQYICDGHSPLLCVRGWGCLTGTGGLNLPADEARRIQDDFVRWAALELQEYMPKWQRDEFTIERQNQELEFYRNFMEYLRDNYKALTYDIMEAVTENGDIEFKGWMWGTTVEKDGKTYIKFNIDGEDFMADWYEQYHYGVRQWCDGEDGYSGYVLLPDAEDLEEDPRTELNRYFVFWYSR